VSSGNDAASIDEQMETMLKEVAELNRFVGVPLLANFYFTHQRFDSVIEIAEPYLADIDDLLVSVFYAESCVYVLKINIFTGFPIYTIVEARSPYEAIEIVKSTTLKEYKKVQKVL
jgi:hypothetical protein